MANVPGLTPSTTLRNLPVSIAEASASPGAAPIQKVATAGDGALVPFPKERLIAVGAPATQILGANPGRKAAIFRATAATASYLVLGAPRNWPGTVDSTNRVGVLVVGQESVTLETTDEIWVFNLAGVAMIIVGAEILQSSAAK